MRGAPGFHSSYTVRSLDSYGSHTIDFIVSLCVSDIINSPRMHSISEMKKPHIRSAWLSNTPRFPCTVSCGVWCGAQPQTFLTAGCAHFPENLRASPQCEEQDSCASQRLTSSMVPPLSCLRQFSDSSPPSPRQHPLAPPD